MKKVAVNMLLIGSISNFVSFEEITGTTTVENLSFNWSLKKITSLVKFLKSNLFHAFQIEPFPSATFTKTPQVTFILFFVTE